MKTGVTNTTTLKSFFEANGFEVVDMRAKGGCLWVVGEEPVLSPYIKKATEQYDAKGKFAQGKATKYRTGWFTKSNN